MKIKSLLIPILTCLSITINSQDTTILELSEQELSWIKAKVVKLENNLIQENRTSTLQGLVDLVYIDTNKPEDVTNFLLRVNSLEEVREKYPQHEVYTNQIAGFRLYRDTLNQDAVELKVESTDLMFMPDYSFVKNEINVLKKNRFWLLRTLRSYEDNLSNKVLGVFIRKEPRRAEFPDGLMERINYYETLSREVQVTEEMKYSIEPLSVNLDTLSYEEKEETLKKALRMKVASFCGQDNSAMSQEVLIYKLSSEVQNWGVFLRSLLKIITDNVSRASDDPRSSAMREKYYFNMKKLGIDPWSFMLGGYIEFEGKRDLGLYIPRQLIPALVFDLDVEKYFTEVLGYVNNMEMDYVNRYRLLKLAATFTQYSKDQEQHDRLVEVLYESIGSFPIEVQEIMCKRIFGKESSRC